MGVRRRKEKEELRAAMWIQGYFFLCTKFICARYFFSLHDQVHLKNKIKWGHPSSLVVLHKDNKKL